MRFHASVRQETSALAVSRDITPGLHAALKSVPNSEQKIPERETEAM
jgi:hypothetical protein